MNQIEWFFPPGLLDAQKEFDSLCDVLYKQTDRRKPLLIMGDRGAGKSAFVDRFEKHYRKNNPAKDKIHSVNIAAIPETLVEDALFGHRKGSFTGAGKDDVPGFVETSVLLILEEIGELPKSVQAKMLTFLEDGIYWPIGERKKHENAKDIQIVATTNKPKDQFRQDFIDRFRIFEVPPLYKRRGDILQYACDKNPVVTGRLTPWQVLSLLSYNWPGNVRELERELENLQLGLPLEGPNWEHLRKLQELLRSIGVEQDAEALLNKYRLGISPINETPAFGDVNQKKAKSINAFDRAFEGMKLFCLLFQQNIEANSDLLALDVKSRRPLPYLMAVQPEIYLNRFPKKYQKTANIIQEHMDNDHYGDNSQAKDATRIRLGTDGVDTSNLNYADADKIYFSRLLKKTNGNKAKAARLSGLRYSTFIDKVKKHGLP